MAEACLWRARVSEIEKKGEEARQYYEQRSRALSSQAAPATEGVFEEANALYKAGEYLKALNVLQKAIPEPAKADPAHMGLIELMYQCHFRLSEQPSGADGYVKQLDTAAQLAELSVDLTCMVPRHEIAEDLWELADFHSKIYAVLVQQVIDKGASAGDLLWASTEQHLRDGIRMMSDVLLLDPNSADCAVRVNRLEQECAVAAYKFLPMKAKQYREDRQELARVYEELANAIEAARQAEIDQNTKIRLKDEVKKDYLDKASSYKE